jgi:hypothetical protein
MAAPLSHDQKRYLSQLSDRAFDRLSAEADGQYFYDDLPATKARQQFRHDQVVKACGKIGLRCCSQDDYLRVKAHFLDLLGETGKALDAHVRAETEGLRVVTNKIHAACREFGFTLGYANKICQRFRVNLDGATEKQLWTVFYTVRNRGLAKRRAAQTERKAA